MSKIHPMIREVIDNDRRHDPWGAAMAAHFALCDVMYHEGLSIPDEWQYRPGLIARHPGVVDMDDGCCDLHDEWLCGYFDHEAMVYAGNVLHRYEGLLDHLGRSY